VCTQIDGDAEDDCTLACVLPEDCPTGYQCGAAPTDSDLPGVCRPT